MEEDPSRSVARVPGRHRISRRRFLAGAGFAASGALLAACGSAVPTGLATPSPGTTTGAGPTASIEPGASAASPGGSAAPPSGSPGASTTPSPSRSSDNPVARENRLAGDRRWDTALTLGVAEAYVGAGSVAPGGALAIHASGGGTVDVEWYRLGWYGGAGARLLRTERGVLLRAHSMPVPDPVTGMVEAGWGTGATMPAPADVPSGMLLAVLRTAGGQAVANAPVVLRPAADAARRAPVLFVSAAATWQAYNTWGGLDFYGNAAGVAVPATQNHRAAVVSFDRPYALDGGAGYLRRWELQFIRWMERNGRDVDYMADVDLERNPDLASGRRMIVMAGHPEYWSRPMRATIEAAVALGVNVAFLTGNEVFWQARLGDGPAGPGTRIICYKSARNDPMAATHPELATCRWRDPPLNDPEAPLVGQMYWGAVRRPADWVVKLPEHWLYEGTHVRKGDHIVNLVGQEFDAFFPALANPGTQILAQGPVSTVAPHPDVPYLAPPVHSSTIYTATSGATVVSAGTFQWSWAIDLYGDRSYRGHATPFDARVERMTSNLFDRLGDGPLAP